MPFPKRRNTPIQPCPTVTPHRAHVHTGDRGNLACPGITMQAAESLFRLIDAQEGPE